MSHHRGSLRNCFTNLSIDRMTGRRVDQDWICSELLADHARIVPVWRSASLVSEGERLGPSLLPVTALGSDPPQPHNLVLLGRGERHTYFAVELPDDDAECPARFSRFGRFRDLKEISPILEHQAAGLLAYARALTFWHRRHRFCGDCGQPTRSIHGGHVRECTAHPCRRRQFPRTDPAVIVLVELGERCLLARQADWPSNLYSVVAGFVEPGESLEDAVAREVAEETSIQVDDVLYQSSQPWPFPSSLMLGFTARALSSTVTLADRELADARWLSRAGIAAALAAGEFRLPSRASIAYRLIEAWFDSRSEMRLSALAGG